jgi:hypothetical protein
VSRGDGDRDKMCLDAGKMMGSSVCSIVSSGGEERRLGLLRAAVTFGYGRRRRFTTKMNRRRP